MKYLYILALTLAFATPALAQTPVAPATSLPAKNSAPSDMPPACATERSTMNATCDINTTIPECARDKKIYVSCMARAEASNGKGPCALEQTLMLQNCTEDSTSTSCHTAQGNFNNCTANPPGY